MRIKYLVLFVYIICLLHILHLDTGIYFLGLQFILIGCDSVWEERKLNGIFFQGIFTDLLLIKVENYNGGVVRMWNEDCYFIWSTIL